LNGARLSTRFSGRTEDKWADVRYDRGLYGIPRLEGVHATLECEKLAHGSHEIVPNTAQIALPRLRSVCIVDVGGDIQLPLGATQ
jgi:hypothetical protein